MNPLSRLIVRAARQLAIGTGVVVLAACSSGPDKPKPAELGANAALITVRQAWVSRAGSVDFPLDLRVNGDVVTVAGSDGTVAAIEATTGRDIWRMRVATPLQAGVGSDGRTVAVVTRDNELVVIQAGQERWRERLPALTHTAPLVAGARVFVLLADRSIQAFDGQGGRRLWTYTRAGEQALAVAQSGVLIAVGNTLVAGMSGRLVGLDPLAGTVRWETLLASPRGANDIERLVEPVGRVSRDGDVVCARAFQASVGCVNTARASVLWSRPANGAQGVHGDSALVVGTEADGKVLAWRRSDGEPVWTSDRLRFRGLGAPQVLGRSVAVGDAQGWLHFLSRQDGSLLTRVPTDGSAIVAGPVLAGNTLVVVTRNGGVFGFRPD